MEGFSREKFRYDTRSRKADIFVYIIIIREKVVYRDTYGYRRSQLLRNKFDYLVLYSSPLEQATFEICLGNTKPYQLRFVRVLRTFNVYRKEFSIS